MTRTLFILLPLFISLSLHGDTGKERPLTLEDFIKLSAAADPEFQRILIEQHYLRYRKELGLPPSDLVLEVSGQYDLFLDDSERNGTEASLSLSKLFPATGTEVSAGYTKSLPSTGYSRSYTSNFTLQVSQPLARNALGRATRMLEKKLDLEESLARHQIVEAYEDYLALLISLYVDWYTAYENLKTGREIKGDSDILYSLIIRKRRYRIAHPEDVNKGRLEVLAAEEELVNLGDQYRKIVERIVAASGLGENFNHVPVKPDDFTGEIDGANKGELPSLKSRTFMILDLLKKQGIMARDIARDNLLPSASLFAGYSALGRDYRLSNPENLFFFGISSELSLGRQWEKAEAGIAQLNLKKTDLERRKSVLTLKRDMKLLSGGMGSEKELISLAREKIKLTRAVVAAEQRNFLIGKADLNDLIEARRQLNRSRYSLVYHQMLLKKLVVEWKRLGDTLVKKRILER